MEQHGRSCSSIGASKQRYEIHRRMISETQTNFPIVSEQAWNMVYERSLPLAQPETPGRVSYACPRAQRPTHQRSTVTVQISRGTVVQQSRETRPRVAGRGTSPPPRGREDAPVQTPPTTVSSRASPAISRLFSILSSHGGSVMGQGRGPQACGTARGRRAGAVRQERNA